MLGGCASPLASITANMPTDVTVALQSTATPGTTPTAVSGAPAIPSETPAIANYPPLDQPPPVDSDQVKQWLAELDLDDVPDYGETTGACSTSPEAAADKDRCWWTCGGCTRPTDITVCPEKYDWGLSYDDGPGPWTPLLLDYLEQEKIKTTFFVVGSRVLSRPDMLRAEYDAGHQISVHTWSHTALTNQSNAQIVAELGWTQKVIKDVIGVTPNTFRPPFGDIDDRVRAIAAKMGMTPIIWTSHEGTNFDTDDWNIPGGTATGVTSLARFQNILETAEDLDTGFIVLTHDLLKPTVDLAVGYMLPLAIQEGKYKLKSISECLGWENSECYIETASNTTVVDNPQATAAQSTSFPVAQATGSQSGSQGSQTSSAKPSESSSSGGSTAAEGQEPDNGALSMASGGLGMMALAVIGGTALLV